MIDRNFIKNWIPNKKNKYEKEYENILTTIQEQDLYIDWNIFERIYNWKASRSKNYLDKENKELYISAFKEISDLDDEEKINFFKKTMHRKKLPGILEPIASTILHFKFPDKFPIIDVRTVGTLRDKGLLRTKKISYNDYREEIFKIFKKCKEEFSFRKIDRALFTYSEEKDKLSRVLEEEKSIDFFDTIANRLLNPQERKMELIRDLEKCFKGKLEKLNDLKN